jgi:hypothetical protein
MGLYVAMSCLQGRPMRTAFDELAQLDVDGIQLTPGNAPTASFAEYIARFPVVTRTHHGFTPLAIRSEVWNDRFELRGSWHSVHPPRIADAAWLPSKNTKACLETMYPGYPLGSGAALEAAMSAGVRLAVDVSHIFIQREQGVLEDRTWRRLQDYQWVEEIHLSSNDGRRDSHTPITKETYGLVWAQRRLTECSTPVVLECYMHKLTVEGRLRQLELARSVS